jgi:hypothetical protein
MPSLTISLLGVRGGRSCFSSIMFHLCLALTISFMLVSCQKVSDYVSPRLSSQDSNWVSETPVDPTSGFAKGGGYEKGTRAQRGARQGQAYYGGLMMMMNMCLREPDDSSGRDLHLNLAPTTDLHERDEAAALFPASAPPHLADLWIYPYAPFDKCLYI